MSPPEWFPRRIEAMDDVDVIVAGGGSAGIATAVTAARLDLRVTLIEKYGFLGGLATAGAVGTICGLFLKKSEGIEYLVGGFPREFSEALSKRQPQLKLRTTKTAVSQPYRPWDFKVVADNLVEKEANIQLLLHSRVIDVIKKDREVEGVVLHTKAGFHIVRSKITIDCTGDGDLAFTSEARTELGENGETQIPSLTFSMGNVDVPKTLSAGEGRLRALLRKTPQESWLHKAGRSSPRIFPSGHKGYVLVKMIRLTGENKGYDCTNPSELTEAETKGRRLVEEAASFLIAQMPGFENAYLTDSATQVGIRETRRIVGEYILTEEDVIQSRKFYDGIACCSWPIELHDKEAETRWRFLEEGSYYQIPYRCLLPLGVERLLVAGRCISSSHSALASVRVIGPCMAEGQAAGSAAYLAIKESKTPLEVEPEALRALLASQGARVE